MPFLQRYGVKLHWQERGAGKPFLFQHGLGGEVSQPLDLFSPPDGVRLIAFDCRGHGQTRPLGDESKISFPSFAEDVWVLLDHLEIERAVIGGISMGAALALHYALECPSQVAGLVLARPAWLDASNPFNTRAYGEIAVLIRERGAVDGRTLFEASEFFQSVERDSPDAAASLLSQFDSPRAEDGVLRLERIPHQSPHPDRKAWASLQIPTLILATQGDPIHPIAYAETLADIIPSARLCELAPKKQHAELHRTQAQQAIEEFLKEITW